MLFLFVLVGAAIVAVIIWRTLGSDQAATERRPRPELPWESATRPNPPRPSPPPRASGPDDDPDFLRKLDERVRGHREDDPPAS